MTSSKPQHHHHQQQQQRQQHVEGWDRSDRTLMEYIINPRNRFVQLILLHFFLDICTAQAGNVCRNNNIMLPYCSPLYSSSHNMSMRYNLSHAHRREKYGMRHTIYCQSTYRSRHIWLLLFKLNTICHRLVKPPLLFNTEWAKKVSCCISGCNVVSYGPI